MTVPELFFCRQEAIEVAQLAKQWSTVISLAHRAAYSDAEVCVRAYCSVVCPHECDLVSKKVVTVNIERIIRGFWLVQSSHCCAGGVIISLCTHTVDAVRYHVLLFRWPGDFAAKPTAIRSALQPRYWYAIPHMRLVSMSTPDVTYS